MKLGTFFAVLSMGAIAALGIGCQAPDDDDGDEVTEMGEEGEEGEVSSAEQGLVAVPFCADLEVTLLSQKFCGFQEGPLDTSPVFVTCRQECVTERHVVFTAPTPGNPSGRQCVTDETTCGPVICPSCD